MKHLIQLALSTLLAFAAATHTTFAAPRPNLVFILTDDQRWDALGCMGDTNAVTPQLDRLAREGVLFRNHFVTTSICCVSRASIFSGQYERRHGIGNFNKPFTRDQWARSYPAQLRQHGYYTGFIGKFGVGNEKAIAALEKEFDFWRGLTGQGGKFFVEPDDATQTHQTARLGEQSLEFLRAAPTNQPFCLSISFTAPHARDGQPRPHTYRPDTRDLPLLADRTLPQRSNAGAEFHQKLPAAVQTSEAHRRWKERFGTPQKFQDNVKDYYRLIAGLDREVGRIVAELKARKLADNTVIIFTSDNGYALGDRQLEGKWFLYEESARDPLIIFDPRLPADQRGRHETALTLNIDFAPTLLDLAGIAPPAAMQGRSLVPLLRTGRPADWRTDFFYEHHFSPDVLPPSEGVRNERWTYIRWINETPLVEELFDLASDPLQSRNLASDPQHAATLESLRQRWSAYAASLK